MRKDMKKVLCERPRNHSSDGYHEVRQKENRGNLEDLPTNRGMRRPYHHTYDGGKPFSDHIMPVLRFLWGCVGRPYDDVWSEICQVVPSNNTVDQHLKDHIKQELKINVVANDNGVFEYSRWNGLTPVEGLYVDPRDGIICATAPDRDNAFARHKTKKHDSHHRGGWYVKDDNGILNGRDGERIKPLDGTTDARQIKGIWYVLTVDQVPPARQVEFIEDGETKVKKIVESRIDALSGCTVWSGHWYYATKHQMSSQELRRHGLINVQDIPCK